MPFSRSELSRAVQSRQTSGRPITTGTRTEKINALRAKISAGQGSGESLVNEDGDPLFVFGETPMEVPYVVA